MALVQFNPQMSRKKKATLILIILVAAASAMWLFISGDVEYADSLAQRGEQDFVIKEYTVSGVGERTVRERTRTLFSYAFIKPEGADFDLSVSGNSNAFSKEQNAERRARLEQIKLGDAIRVKVCAPELAEAEQNNPWLWLKRFATADQREVEIYHLEKDGAIILPDADIHHSDKLSRQGGKLAAVRLMIVLAVAALSLYLTGVAATKLKARHAICVFWIASFSAEGFAADSSSFVFFEEFGDKNRTDSACQNEYILQRLVGHYADSQERINATLRDEKMQEALNKLLLNESSPTDAQQATILAYSVFCLRSAINLHTFNKQFKPQLNKQQERLVEKAAFISLSSKVKYTNTRLADDTHSYVHEHFADMVKILKQAADYDRFRDEMVRLAKAAVAGDVEIPADAPVRIYFDNDNIVVLFETQLPDGVLGGDYHAMVTVNAATKKVESILVSP